MPTNHFRKLHFRTLGYEKLISFVISRDIPSYLSEISTLLLVDRLWKSTRSFPILLCISQSVHLCLWILSLAIISLPLSLRYSPEDKIAFKHISKKEWWRLVVLRCGLLLICDSFLISTVHIFVPEWLLFQDFHRNRSMMIWTYCLTEFY